MGLASVCLGCCRFDLCILRVYLLCGGFEGGVLGLLLTSLYHYRELSLDVERIMHNCYKRLPLRSS